MIEDVYYIENIIPEHEPERQFYFIKKMQEIMFAKEQEYGRKLTYHISTFGCQMNFKDSEKLAGVLEEIGFTEVEDEKADFCLYNTCTVRENANSRVYGRLGFLGKLKSRNPQMIIAMCGCMMQEEHVVETIKKSYRFVDIIFGTHNIYKLAELLYEYFEENGLIDINFNSDKRKTDGSTNEKDGKMTSKKKKQKKHQMVVDILKGTDKIVEELPSKLKASFKAGINIMFGCNNFCTYCIVPYVRGRERSRKPEDIINEIKDFVSKGVIEVMLLGQNVNSYGKNLENSISFAELLKQVDEIEGLKRIRFMTSHPKDLSDELIEVMKNAKKVCHHIHLPVQSGSSRLLKKMNRVYSKEDYLRLIDKIRAAIPDIAITTDIIVGFPGETDEDFEETLDVVRYSEFSSAFTFIYSKRTGTPAANMPDQVDEVVIKERFDRLLKEVGKYSEKYAKSLEGRVMPVLVEERDREVDPEKNYLTGRLDNNLIVHFEGKDELIGKIVNVKLSDCKGFYYIGELS
jgi:tRNA-2-methylthio-N6-dimethylallyladenosine synthase